MHCFIFKTPDDHYLKKDQLALVILTESKCCKLMQSLSLHASTEYFFRTLSYK